MFCKYKDIFGKPKEGVHSYRIMNIAVVDLALTLIGAYILSILLGIAYWKTAIGLLILGTIAHLLFCVDTTVTIFVKKMLGL